MKRRAIPSPYSPKEKLPKTGRYHLDGRRLRPDGGIQDIVTYAQSVSDPVNGYLNIKVSYGSAKIVKTSEDGKVEGISFTITGNGVNKTVKTGAGGVIQIDNLTPGVYTVTEQNYDKYEPQEVRRVTVVSGQVATVNFSNVLKRGDLVVTKTSEDDLNEGVTFSPVRHFSFGDCGR